MEAIVFSETSVPIRTARRYIPEDGNIKNCVVLLRIRLVFRKSDECGLRRNYLLVNVE
jgi:hypothetical protein